MPQEFGAKLETDVSKGEQSVLILGSRVPCIIKLTIQGYKKMFNYICFMWCFFKIALYESFLID